MKTIFAILMMLLSSTAMAQNKVVVVPLGDSGPECFISGDGVDCIPLARLHIPMGQTLSCSSRSGYSVGIGYEETGQYVKFYIGSAKKPVIQIEFSIDSPVITFQSFVELADSSDYLLASGVEVSFCQGPEITQHSNFNAVDKEWKLTPVFSWTTTTVTLEELLLDPQ